MTRILGLSGSLRQGSFNTALLRAAAGLMPPGSELVIRTLHGIPLYDGDLEAAGIPEPVQQLKELVTAADGLLISTPEYNNSVPGVLKNGIDWLSRPSSDIKRVFGGKPVAMIGATPGPYGTVLAQSALLPILRTLATRPWFGSKLMVGDADDAFDGSLALRNAEISERLKAFLAGFVAFAQAK